MIAEYIFMICSHSSGCGRVGTPPSNFATTWGLYACKTEPVRATLCLQRASP